MRQEWRNCTPKRRDIQKKGPGENEVTLKQRLLEERREHHSLATRRANIYLTDSDEEAIVDFVKDHKLYDKTSEHFKDKARKECLWERFANIRTLSSCAGSALSRRGHVTAI